MMEGEDLSKVFMNCKSDKFHATQHSTMFRVYSSANGRRENSDRGMRFIITHNGKGWEAYAVEFNKEKGFGVNPVGERIRVHPNDRYDYDKIAHALGLNG